jgi:uncharacterized membrane protein
MNNWLMVVLRLTHVLSGVFWAGATIVFASHVTPSVKATGAEGQKFMQHVAGKSSLSLWLTIAAILAALSGTIMYFVNWLGNHSSQGNTLILGMLFGWVAFFHGLFAQRRTILKLQKMGEKVAASGGPPSPEEAQTMGNLSDRISRNGVILAYLLALTVVLMGVFQYVIF